MQRYALPQKPESTLDSPNLLPGKSFISAYAVIHCGMEQWEIKQTTLYVSLRRRPDQSGILAPDVEEQLPSLSSSSHVLSCKYTVTDLRTLCLTRIHEKNTITLKRNKHSHQNGVCVLSYHKNASGFLPFSACEVCLPFTQKK